MARTKAEIGKGSPEGPHPCPLPQARERGQDGGEGMPGRGRSPHPSPLPPGAGEGAGSVLRPGAVRSKAPGGVGGEGDVSLIEDSLVTDVLYEGSWLWGTWFVA